MDVISREVNNPKDEQISKLTESDMTYRGMNRFIRSNKGRVLILVVITSFVVIVTDLHLGLNAFIRGNKVDSLSLDYNVFQQEQNSGEAVVQVSDEYQTQICKRPKLSLYNDAIQHAFYKMDPLECIGHKLFYLRDGILRLNYSVLNTEKALQQTALREFEKRKGTHLTENVKMIKKCEYLAIERVSDDYPTYTESIVKIKEPFDIIIKHDFIRVQCRLNKSEKNEEGGIIKKKNDYMYEDDEFRQENMKKNRRLLYSVNSYHKTIKEDVHKMNKTSVMNKKNVLLQDFIIKQNGSRDIHSVVRLNDSKIINGEYRNISEKNKNITSMNNLKNDLNDSHYQARRIADYDHHYEKDGKEAENKLVDDPDIDRSQEYDFQQKHDFHYYDDHDMGHADPDDDVDFDQFLVQIYPKDAVFKRISKILLANKESDKQKINVLIIGLDSMSHLAYQRKLPQTYRYLRDTLEGIILHGYNIVGDATTAALIPILTGKSEPELPEVRKNQIDAEYVDSYPMIWDQFKKKGYVTLFAEDEPSISTFNLRLNGFKDQPTDHYMRPFWQTLWSSSLRELSAKYCTGATPNHMFMFDYLQDFYIKYKNVSKFSFTFLSELTHWDNNPGEYMDNDFLNFLKLFKTSGYLDNTLLILMADHGARYSKVRFTVQGKMEERLPLMSFVFPNFFQKRYPHLMRNLKRNSNRLATPFDIHETLRDVLDISRTKTKPSTNQRGISLLQEIPLNRTCTSAHIDIHWCTCLSRRDLNVGNTLVKKCATVVIQHINQLTEPVRDLCAKLTLKKILLAYLIIPNEKVLKYIESKDEDNRVANFSQEIKLDTAHYQVTIETHPNDAMFEATLLVNFIDGSIKVYPDISRLSLYGNQPACVQKRYPDLRKYCYCKNLLTKKSGKKSR